MTSTRIDVSTTDGVMDCHVFTPPGAGKWPAVLFYFDAFGIRPDSAEWRCDWRGTGMSWRCPIFSIAPVRSRRFRPQPHSRIDRSVERLMALIASIDNEKVMHDTDSVLLISCLRHPSVRGDRSAASVTALAASSRCPRPGRFRSRRRRCLDSWRGVGHRSSGQSASAARPRPRRGSMSRSRKSTRSSRPPMRPH